MDLVLFGKKLRAARKARGLTQHALAELASAAGIDTSNQYIGLLENATPHESSGEPRQPSLELVKFLARELGQSGVEFLYLTGHAGSALHAILLVGPEQLQHFTDAQREKLGRVLERAEQEVAKIIG